MIDSHFRGNDIRETEMTEKGNIYPSTYKEQKRGEKVIYWGKII